MIKFVKTIAFLIVLTGTANVKAALIETVDWNGTTYGLLSAGTWLNVQSEASSLGGNLVTIDSNAEQEFLFDLWGDSGSSTTTFRFLWIGYNDFASEGNFVWASGETPNFTSWIFNEPNNQGNEDGVWMQRHTGSLADNTIITNGIGWNDATNNVSSIGGVMEFASPVSAPSMSALFLLFAVLAGLRKIRKPSAL
jgi:hypothetical protein